MSAALKQRPWLLALVVLALLAAGLLVVQSRGGGDAVSASAVTTSTSTTARATTTTSTTTSTTTTTMEPPTTEPPPTEPPATAAPQGATPPTYAPATQPPATEPPAPSGSFDTGAAAQIVAYMNSLRAGAAGPLSIDGCLTGLAQGWAQSMGERGSMSHNPGFAGCNGTAAENVGNWSPCDTAAMDAWWNASPGHHANMVNPAYGTVGVGVYRDGNGACWYAVDFGP